MDLDGRLPLSVGQRAGHAVFHQLGETNDRAERGAKLVGDRRQEARFRLAGVFKRVGAGSQGHDRAFRSLLEARFLCSVH